MGRIHDDFVSMLLKEHDSRAVARCLARVVLARHQVEPKDEVVQYLSECLLARAEGGEIPPAPDGVDDFTLTVTGEDMKHATQEFARELVATTNAKFIDTWEASTVAMHEFATIHEPQIAADRRSVLENIAHQIEAEWGRAISKLELMLSVAVDAHEEATYECENRNPKLRTGPGAKFRAMSNLHALCCRITGEVLCLLRSGYADGAMARWRSLHEGAVIASFISGRPAAVASAYLDFSAVEQLKDAKTYAKYYRRLGYEALPRGFVRQCQDRVDQLVQKHGEGFRKPYGWAHKTLALKQVTFVDIEKRCRLSMWRPYYGMGNAQIHAGPRSLPSSLGVVHHEGAMHVGPSPFGLSAPGRCAASSLALATSCLLNVNSTIDHLARVRVMLVLADEVDALFAEVAESQKHLRNAGD